MKTTMYITSSQSRIINRFERAVREHEMMGSMDPDDHESIQFEYESAKEALKFKFMRVNPIKE